MINFFDNAAPPTLSGASLLACLLVFCPVALSEDNPKFGGPDSVERTMETDHADKGGFIETKLFAPLEQWQENMSEQHGFSLGMDYSTVALSASESLSGADDSAGGGVFRVYGRWNLTGDGATESGGLVYKLEHRHSFGDSAPSDFYLGSVGYAGLTAPTFSDQGARFTNFYWRESINSGRTVVLGGFLDATDFLDVYGLASPWLHFMNLAFSTGSASIDLPNDAALGVGAGHLFDNNMYVIGSVIDRNSDPTDISKGFDTFFGDNEYFSSIEIGHTSSHSRIALDNVHLTLWQVDAREEVDAPDGWGANFSWSRYFNNQFMPFLRAGYTKDSSSLLGKSVSMGFGYRLDPLTAAPGNLLGAAVNWGKVNTLSFGPDLDDQYTMEVFYRWQTTEQLALTADFQYLKNPALNPSENDVYVWSIRARFAI